MSNQTYVRTTSDFDDALNAFQKAVEDKDEHAIRQARQQVEKLAATQALEYDQEVRHGLLHHYREWQNDSTDQETFVSNLLKAIYAGIPNSNVPGASFYQAFPQLNQAGTRHGGLRFASIFTERILLVHEAMLNAKAKESI